MAAGDDRRRARNSERGCWDTKRARLLGYVAALWACVRCCLAGVRPLKVGTEMLALNVATAEQTGAAMDSRGVRVKFSCV